MLLWLTAIGVPLAIGNVKVIPLSLVPFGREIVRVRRAKALGVSPQIPS